MYSPIDDHVITYKFTDLVSYDLIAELPVNNLQFSTVVNSSGPFQCTLNVEDPDVRASDWIDATAPNKTAVWVDIDGTLVYGGRITGRDYTMSQQRVQLTGSDFYGYCSQRLQAADYTAYTDPQGNAWATTGAASTRILYYILSQAMAVAHSIPIDIVAAGTDPASGFWITFTAPQSQQQSLDSMAQNLVDLGYQVGVDIACDVSYVAGITTPALTISYPRRGRVAGTTGLTFELSDAIDIQWEEDGTAQANGIVEQTGSSGSVATENQWAPSMQIEGYPLLESSISHASMSPTSTPQSVLDAFSQGDLSIYAYPAVAPVITMPLFGTIDFTGVIIGDDALLYLPQMQNGIPSNPRFPNGLSLYMRTVRADVSIPDEGVPTVDWTFNVPPATTPTPPPA